MLPSKTSALIQPMDQGVIMALKSQCKKLYSEKFAAFTLSTNSDPMV